MEKLLLELLDKCKTDKKSLKVLKNLSVDLQLYDLGAELRRIEKELFPESKEEKQAKEIQIAMQMVEVNASVEIAFVLGKLFDKIHEKGKEFSLKDAAEILAEKQKLF